MPSPAFPRVIAIDGPAASGKSTVARLVAARLGGYYISTGEMYRALAWELLRRGVDPAADPAGVAALLPQLKLHCELRDGRPELVLNGERVPAEAVRAPEIAAAASVAAAIPAVRAWLLERQRDTARLGLVVLEGRDIGTVVFPDTPHKFFITARSETRAQRRLAQAGETAPGATVASVAAEIAERDRRDATRAIAPLRPAADAVIIETDSLTAEAVAARICAHL
jgi:CMP/dCMP kinase